MALTDADRMQMTALALMKHHVVGGAPIGRGEFIQDGLKLDINPEVDSYELDAEGYIEKYRIHGYENKGIPSLRIGDMSLWDEVGGTFTIIDVDNISMTNGSSNNRALHYTRKSDYADCNILYKLKLDGSGSIFGATFLRISTVSTTGYNGYRLALSAGALNLAVAAGGTITSLSTKSMTTVKGAWYSIRFKAEGTSIKAKIWPDGGGEPSAWDIEVTDGTYSSGRIAVYIANANTSVYVRNMQIGPCIGQAIILRDSELKSKNRIFAETSFTAYYEVFGLPNTMPRTVFMLYRLREDGLRYNAKFFRETGTSLAFGVVGKNTETSDNKNVISIFGVAGTVSYIANQYDISISRQDRYEMVCAKAEDNTTGIAGYTYGVQEITNRSKQWADLGFTEFLVPAGMEFVRLLYYDRVLTEEEIEKVHQYLAFNYGTNLYLTSDYLRI